MPFSTKISQSGRLDVRRSLGFADEQIDPDEPAMIAEIAAMSIKTISVRNGIARRGQHAKHHGCVRANFIVMEDISAEFRMGIFARPRTYQALVRFSNGSNYDDRKPDAHGMAIKLLDVDGTKLLEDIEDRRSQDFVLVDQPVFFSRSLREYVVFNRYFTRIQDFLKNWRRDVLGFLPRLAGLIYGGLVLRLFFADLLGRARQFASATPSSPLTIRYWSSTPYLLGGQAVKYMVRPSKLDGGSKGVASENGLGDALRRELHEGPATFIFGIHPQSDPDRQPIEDPTVNWHIDLADFVPLAQIVIEMQEVKVESLAESLAERLVFSPWHSLPEHRPLGAVNRTRREVYVAMAKSRLEANKWNDSLGSNNQSRR